MKIKDQKSVFWNILPFIEKNQKWTPKIQKFENPSKTHKFYVNLGTKRYLGPRDPIIGIMGYGGGAKLKVQGMDFYPVNECICMYVYVGTYHSIKK